MEGPWEVRREVWTAELDLEALLSSLPALSRHPSAGYSFIKSFLLLFSVSVSQQTSPDVISVQVPWPRSFGITGVQITALPLPS